MIRSVHLSPTVVTVGAVAALAAGLIALGLLSTSPDLAAVWAGIAVVLGAATLVLAHLRRHLPGDSRYAPHPAKRSSRMDPAGFGFMTLIGAALLVYFTVMAVQSHADADRSFYVQRHGVPDVAITQQVQNIAHQGKTTSYTFQITVALGHTSVGDGTAVVYGNGQTSAEPGMAVSVLVDPRQPDYAELPGNPYYSTGSWVAPVICAAFFVPYVIFSAREAVITGLRQLAWTRARRSAVTG
jgi:hypothetical protein